LPAHLFEQLHPEWKTVLQSHEELISEIEIKLIGVDVAPEFPSIFRALTRSIDSTKVVIFGQDPYPTRGHAHGLAFSVDSSVSPLPASLRNIFTELATDCGITRTEGDLSDWFDQGVMLLNRVLTTQSGISLMHSGLGWQSITDAVAKELGKRKVVAILWGKSAGELSQYFTPELRIESSHPSPLSSYRGFFGSKPFSRVNSILEGKGLRPINW
jgi:uracil-DNA glycosylase